jgi:hypothetical protein
VDGAVSIPWALLHVLHALSGGAGDMTANHLVLASSGAPINVLRLLESVAAASVVSDRVVVEKAIEAGLRIPTTIFIRR